jgi:hypothetical protein
MMCYAARSALQVLNLAPRRPRGALPQQAPQQLTPQQLRFLQ